MRRNTVPSRPYRFFAALWALMRPKGLMQILVAEEHTACRTALVAGSIFFAFGTTFTHAFTGSSRDSLPLRPNDVLLWEAFNEAQRRGFHFVDLGEVSHRRPGVARFKTKWGADPVRPYRYNYPHHAVPSVDSVDRDQYIATLAQHLWPVLPLETTAWLSERIYRYL